MRSSLPLFAVLADRSHRRKRDSHERPEAECAQHQDQEQRSREATTVGTFVHHGWLRAASAHLVTSDPEDASGRWYQSVDRLADWQELDDKARTATVLLLALLERRAHWIGVQRDLMSRRFIQLARGASPSGGQYETLFARARRDPQLFAEFYVQRREPVLGFFGRRVLDPETAFDLMAETFAAAFASLPDFRGHSDGEADAWLWTIARSQLHRWRDRRAVEGRCLAQLSLELAPLAPAEFERIEELASLDRVKPALIDALDALAGDQREAIRMRVIDEWAYPHIAEEIGVSEDVVRARVSRGLRELALVLEPQRIALQEATR